MCNAVTADEQRAYLDDAISLPDLFRRVAALRGAAEALRDNGRTLSYRELDLVSDRLAAELVAEGVRVGDRVGILLHRSVEIPVSILAVLKAGAAYVPLEPSYPAERLRYLTGDAGIKLVIGDAEHVASCGLTEVRVVAPDTGRKEPLPPPRIELDGSELAYIIYTSGSTGTPKGCMIAHAGVLELLRSEMPVLGLGSRHRVTLSHPFIFDGSVNELWLALASGGTAIVVPSPVALSVPDFVELLRREEVTLISQVPTAFGALAYCYEEAGRPRLALRYVVLGGESVDLGVISAFADTYRGTPPTVVNVYGPTEVTCVATCRVLSRADLGGAVRSPIGTALPHLVVEVRGEGMELLPDGEVGELVVAGSSVAIGYLGRPELTAERFVVLDTPTGRRRYYRTGDLARRLADGSFDYVGRNDQQVKVRGARVEPGEVESFLRAHALVKDAAAAVVTSPAGTQFFVACVVLADQRADGPEAVLRRHMRENVPGFMLPDRYHFVPALPLTASGKLDRRALRDMAMPRRTARP
ncbi:amino acid adenylation domain-containing protein [Actinacidiphila sp. bgisy144]|uniref:amino acid adenylation domain-containing protein n=1 Tax=Actinacidiphila sp. bgisy144 TaxID=3413791 RepID=UPI003EBCD055